MFTMRLLTAACLLPALLTQVSALATIERSGRFLYNSTDGSRFYIKGVAYQPQGTLGNNGPNAFPEPTDFVDPLADSAGCARDLPLLKQLGVNTLRVYSIDATKNHDSCVQALEQAGIYLLIDLSLPVNGSIDRASPAWSTNLLDLYIENINAFLPYSNILGFNIGNEIITSANQTAAGPFIKAAARDVKAYLKSKSSRALVGYSSVDGARNWLLPLARFLSCDSDADSLDIYGLNNYEWCGDSNINDGYAQLVNDFNDYNIPAYFSEYGCQTSPPRLFTEVAAMFGPVMTPVFSGGIAFSYFQATVAGFNLVDISSDLKTATPNDDFRRLQAQYSNVTFNNSPSQSSAGPTTFPQCPQQNSTFLASTTLPPTPNDKVCQCFANTSFSCLFNPTTTDITPIVGSLLGSACGLIAQAGASCDTIASDGSTGKYGTLAMCDPATKASWAFSEYYEITNRNIQSCTFAGNATVSPTAPTSSNAAEAAGNSCLAAAPSGTFVPTAASSVANASPTSGGGSSGGSGSGSTALIARIPQFALFWGVTMTLMVLAGLVIF